ncbi:hypothetical protein NIT60_14335 [Mammaliicoccus sciuri]|nr:hypothetical protein NIT60_14335 [Mammaliicoccus sciuri]
MLEAKDDTDEEKEGKLPPLEKGDIVTAEKIDPKQHFTQPPPRYTGSTFS